MPIFAEAVETSGNRSRSARFHVLLLLSISIFGAAVSAEEQVLRIHLTVDSVAIGDSEICSEDELKLVLSQHSKDKHIHVENSPTTDTGRVLKLLEIVRNLGYEQVTSTSAGTPGWTLYPLANDRDIFGCEESER